MNMHKLYRELHPGFHCFPVPGMVLGLEYSRPRDALFFSTLICQMCPKSDSMDPAELAKVADARFNVPDVSQFISRPVSGKEAGVPWFNNITGTFNLAELPDEIKIMIKQIGIKKKDLLRPQTAKPIFDILQQIGLANTESLGEKNDEEEEKQDDAQ